MPYLPVVENINKEKGILRWDDALVRSAIAALVLLLSTVTAGAIAQSTPPSAAVGPDLSSFLSSFYTHETSWLHSITVDTPAYCSEISGDVVVTFTAPGMTTVHACCWQQPTTDNSSPWGHDVDVAPDLKLDADGHGQFVFHADQFPNGPINLRIYAKDGGSKQDYCELQLFNKSGVVWNQGIPETDPPAAKGMKLAFSDDFDAPLSIAGDNSAKYWTHWPGGDGSLWPFTDNKGPLNPFSQVKGKVKNFLRIHASKPEGTKGGTGDLTSVHPDRTGFTATAPCYFECRFLAQNATGTWPAFWILTQPPAGSKTADEMDAIEGYGTNAKSGGIWTGYEVTTHFWGQPRPAWATDKRKGPDGNPYVGHRRVDPMALGGGSSWSTTFHTYGVLVTPTFTAYYFDNIEVLRHPSGQLSATQPMFFLLNLAIGGGGWHPDLQRYGNQSDMWVDFVRVYQGESR